MKPKLALLAATAVGALFTISLAGAIQPHFNNGPLPAAAGSPSDENSATFVLANNDHDDGERQSWKRHRLDDDDEDDDDDKDDDNRGVTRNTAPARQAAPASAPVRTVAPPASAPVRAVAPLAPAPAGEAARPANRLFGNGAPPRVQVN